MTSDSLVILALVALVCPLAATVLSLWVSKYTLIAGSFISLVITAALAFGAPELLPIQFTFVINFYLDALSIYFMLLVNLAGFIAAWFVDRERSVELGADRNPYHFRALFGTFHLSLLLVPMVNDLFVLWLIVELTTIVSVVLLLYGAASTAPEAGWKYLCITIPGLILTFIGTALVVSALPADTMMHWSDLVQVAVQLNPRLIRLAFVLIFLGYGAKAGLAPLHTWLPDVHGEAPSPVSALLSGVLLKVALFAILRWTIVTNLALGGRAFTSGLFLAFGVLSLGIATLAILKQNKFKRVLAYHSLEHMGIIAFGLGVGSPLAIFGALLHTLNHALTKELMFLTFGNIRQRYVVEMTTSDAIEMTSTPPVRSIEPITMMDFDEKQIQGALKATPVSGGLLALGGLSLVGSPPFNIFLSEFIILWAAIQTVRFEHSVALIVAMGIFLISITFIFGGLISHLSKILLDVPPFDPEHERLGQLWPLLFLLTLILAFGLTIPALGPVDFPELLNRCTCIVLGGTATCQ
jgi:hydrogenase-4 component F